MLYSRPRGIIEQSVNKEGLVIMCVGVAVTLAPPTALVCGWFLWGEGQSFVLSRCHLPRSATSRYEYSEERNNSSSPSEPAVYDVENPPRQNILTYSAGLLTLGGTFIVQDSLIQRWEAASGLQQQGEQAKHNAKGNAKYFLPHKDPTYAFQPPQTPQELIQRLGRPLLSRLAAASVSFFCAGVVQTYLAAALQR